MLFHKLLWAARPELVQEQLFAESLDHIREPMHPDERSSIFRFVQSVARAEMRNPDTIRGNYHALEALSFLAPFDTPVAPLIEAWKAETEPVARGRFCLLLAEYIFTYEPASPMVRNCYTGDVPILPDNAKAMAAMVIPGFVAAYLAEHADCAALFGGEYETGVAAAFDYATAVLHRER
jgi:hypothetical protein